MTNKPLKIARVSTVIFFLDHQLRHQIEEHQKLGFEISAVTSSSGDWSGLNKVPGLRCVKLDIAREPAPLLDIISTFRLYRLFKKEGYDIVHSTTPKAGLLCALAGWLAGTPIRIHTFTGQTWTTKSGLSKRLLRFMDKCIVALNTQCYADSHSQRDYLVHEGVGHESTIKTLGYGSLAGVDLSRFDTNAWNDQKNNIRKELQIKPDDFVLLFIGRLSKEKGIYELLESFQMLQEKISNVHLLLVGPCEEIAIEKKLQEWNSIPGVNYLGQTDIPEKYLSISDLLCLPSYREGFGTVVIEAASMRVPTLGTNINGLKDAVDDGVTGLLVQPGNAQALYSAMSTLVADRDTCSRMGDAAFERCVREFDARVVSKLVAQEYNRLTTDKQQKAKK